MLGMPLLKPHEKTDMIRRGSGDRDQRDPANVRNVCRMSIGDPLASSRAACLDACRTAALLCHRFAGSPWPVGKVLETDIVTRRKASRSRV